MIKHFDMLIENQQWKLISITLTKVIIEKSRGGGDFYETEIEIWAISNEMIWFVAHFDVSKICEFKKENTVIGEEIFSIVSCSIRDTYRGTSL